MSAQRKQEIEQNFRAFENYVSSLLPEHAGEFALLSGRQLIGVFPRAFEAMAAGHDRFGDGHFSVQRITNRPLDLGFLSYASSDRDTI